MIDHKEVRIGNTLKSSDSIKLINVFHIDEDDDRGRINYIGANNYEPVELTPDILEAAGWYWNNEAGCYEHSDVRMSMNHNSISGWTMFNYVLKAKITNKIFYLHQLQNLYWCLCGQELQIDLTKLNKEK